MEEGPIFISSQIPDKNKLIEISQGMDSRPYSFYMIFQSNIFIERYINSLDQIDRLKKRRRLADYYETIDSKIRSCKREFILVLYYYQEGVHDKRTGNYIDEDGNLKSFSNIIPKEVSGLDESEEYTNFFWYKDSIEKYLYQFYSSYNLIYFIIKELFDLSTLYAENSSMFRKDIIKELKEKGYQDIANLLNEFFQKYKKTIFDWRNAFVHYQNPFKVLREDQIGFPDTKSRIKEFSMVKVYSEVISSWNEFAETCLALEDKVSIELKENL